MRALSHLLSVLLKSFVTLSFHCLAFRAPPFPPPHLLTPSFSLLFVFVLLESRNPPRGLKSSPQPFIHREFSLFCEGLPPPYGIEAVSSFASVFTSTHRFFFLGDELFLQPPDWEGPCFLYSWFDTLPSPALILGHHTEPTVTLRSGFSVPLSSPVAATHPFFRLFFPLRDTYRRQYSPPSVSPPNVRLLRNCCVSHLR